jgi:hypothetical protein
MKALSRLLLVGALAFDLAAVSGVCKADDVNVTRAEFGVFVGSKFTPTNKVPLTEGQQYGWRIFVTTGQKAVRIREEFTLPEAPKTWGQPPAGTSISADGRTSVIDHDELVIDGLIVHGWAVAKGDPPGAYSIRVDVEGRPAAAFKFDVQ